MKKTLLALGIAATLTAGGASVATSASAATVAPTAQSAAGSPVADPMVADGKWRLFDTSSDVNGDGHIDGVWLRKKSDRVCQVRVTSGTRHVQRDLRAPDNTCTYAGSALFDTRKGAEIKVMTGMGAHTPWDHIVTYRKGRLKLQKSPERTRWTMDSAAMYAEGYRRVVNKDGKVRLRHDFVNRHGKVWKGNRKVLAYRGGEWVQLRKKHITRTTKQVNRLAGWHVRGFKRWM